MKYSTDALAGTRFIRMSGILTVLMLIIVLLLPKSDSFIAANAFHRAWMDTLFLLLTQLGDGMFALFLVILFFLLKKRAIAYKITATFLLSGIAAQAMKNLFHAPRPKAFYSSGTYQHFIDGVTCGGFNSFPSGHATTAFAMASILSFNITCKKWSAIFFILATLVVYSRIYLGQHFIEDTLAGIILGVSSSLVIEQLNSRHFVNGPTNSFS
jgi:membrane-associated phospholipid phosphatase